MTLRRFGLRGGRGWREKGEVVEVIDQTGVKVVEGEKRKAEMQVLIRTWASTTWRWSGSWRCG